MTNVNANVGNAYRLSPSDEYQWRQMRAFGITGSDACIIATGRSHFGGKTIFDLWEEKANKLVPEKIDSPYMARGRKLEKVLFESLQEEKPEWEVQSIPEMLFHKEYGAVRGNIDGLIINENKDPMILEIKTAQPRAYFNWIKDIPQHYLAQVLHYCLLTGISKYCFYVGFSFDNIQMFEGEFEQKDIESLKCLELEFWKAVESKTPIVAKAYNTSSDDFNKVYKNAKANMQAVKLDNYYDMLMSEYLNNATEITKISDRNENIERMIKEKMQESSNAFTDKHSVVWTCGKRQFSEELFKEKDPGLYQSLTKKQTKTIDMQKLQIDYRDAFVDCLLDVEKTIPIDKAQLKKTNKKLYEECMTEGNRTKFEIYTKKGGN